MVCVLISWLKHAQGVISHGTILINLLIPLSLATAFGKGKEDGRLGSKVPDIRKNRNKNEHIGMSSHGHQCVYTGNRSHLSSISQREGDQCSAAQSAPGVYGWIKQFNHHNRFLKRSVDENKYKIAG